MLEEQRLIKTAQELAQTVKKENLIRLIIPMEELISLYIDNYTNCLPIAEANLADYKNAVKNYDKYNEI